MASATDKHIVFVDIPDTDNIMMVYQVLRDFPNEHIPIVLSPRPVDFRIARYGRDFPRLRSLFPKGTPGNRRMLLPVTHDSTWVNALGQDKESFTIDATFRDESVREDTELYMRLSELRFAELLDSMGISPDRYTFYRDGDLENSKIQLGLRHAAHVHDFTYGFNEAEMDEYNKIWTSNEGKSSDSYRTQLRKLCRSYISRMSAGAVTGRIKSRPFRELIKADSDNKIKRHLLVGGPFTEVLKYMKKVKVKGILAMAGFITGGTSETRNKDQINLFANQFNFHVDLTSAQNVLDIVVEKGIPIKLLPTECVKESSFELEPNELATIFPGSAAVPVPLIRRVADRYIKDSGASKSYMFDWIAAILFTSPKLLPSTRRMRHEIRLDKETQLPVLWLEEDGHGPIEVFFNDKEIMKKNRPSLLKKMKVSGLKY